MATPIEIHGPAMHECRQPVTFRLPHGNATFQFFEPVEDDLNLRSGVPVCVCPAATTPTSLLPSGVWITTETMKRDSHEYVIAVMTLYGLRMSLGGRPLLDFSRERGKQNEPACAKWQTPAGGHRPPLQLDRPEFHQVRSSEFGRVAIH